MSHEIQFEPPQFVEREDEPHLTEVIFQSLPDEPCISEYSALVPRPIARTNSTIELLSQRAAVSCSRVRKQAHESVYISDGW